MVTDNFLRSFGDVSIVEDVVGLIEILTATEDWFLNNLEKTEAISTVHQTQTDTLRSSGSAAIEEAADLSLSANSTPSLIPNLVEQVAITFGVSFIQDAVQHYFGGSELARQIQKGITDWSNASEYDIVRSTMYSVGSGTATKFDGIINGISLSTNTTAHDSGTAWSASILNGLMRDAWDNSNGKVATDLFMGPYLRFVTDDFTQKTNNVVTVPVNTIDNMIDYYVTSFGRVGIHVHRYLHIAATDTGLIAADSATSSRVLAVRTETIKLAFLQRPFTMELAQTGPTEKRSVIGSFTMEFKNQQSNWWATGFLAG